MFGYHDGSYSDYNGESFTPYFLDDLESQTKADDPQLFNDIDATCGANIECRYDGFAAKSLTVSEQTKSSSESLDEGSKQLGRST